MSEPLLLVGASTSNQNLYYKSRFLAGDPFLYLEFDHASALVVPRMEMERARKESGITDVLATNDLGYVEFRREHGDSRSALALVAERVLRDRGVTSVLVEPTLPLQFADTLRAQGIDLVIDSRIIVEERRRKSDEEIAAIEAAQSATERALEAGIRLIAAAESHAGILHFNGIPLTSERVRTEIEFGLLREDLVSEVDSIVAGGREAADPHAHGAGPLRWGEPIVMDIFPRSRSSRYFADITRTVVKGEPSDTVRAMYEAVLQAHETALSMIRPGANGADVHRAVLDVLRDAGYNGNPEQPSMPHGTGHGIGLDVHEAPGLGQLDVELMEGDVITIEPGLYHPDVGGIRIEDAIAVTADGYRNLTSLSKRFQLGA